jgi:DNA-binding transcriptional ArsR family regulator
VTTFGTSGTWQTSNRPRVPGHPCLRGRAPGSVVRVAGWLGLSRRCGVGLRTLSAEANNCPLLSAKQSLDATSRPPTLEDLESVFTALSHEVRRHIVVLLSHRGGELPSGYLAKRFAHSWPTTTRHLHVLEAAGLVSVRREGRNCVYRLERDRLRGVVGAWLSLLNPPTPEQTWRSSGRHSMSKGKQR